jgi:hypothetical protein
VLGVFRVLGELGVMGVLRVLSVESSVECAGGSGVPVLMIRLHRSSPHHGTGGGGSYVCTPSTHLVPCRPVLSHLKPSKSPRESFQSKQFCLIYSAQDNLLNIRICLNVVIPVLPRPGREVPCPRGGNASLRGGGWQHVWSLSPAYLCPAKCQN